MNEIKNLPRIHPIMCQAFLLGFNILGVKCVEMCQITLFFYTVTNTVQKQF